MSTFEESHRQAFGRGMTPSEWKEHFSARKISVKEYQNVKSLRVREWNNPSYTTHENIKTLIVEEAPKWYLDHKVNGSSGSSGYSGFSSKAPPKITYNKFDISHYRLNKVEIEQILNKYSGGIFEHNVYYKDNCLYYNDICSKGIKSIDNELKEKAIKRLPKDSNFELSYFIDEKEIKLNVTRKETIESVILSPYPVFFLFNQDNICDKYINTGILVG